MATRRESVRLDLTGNFTPQMMKAAAATELLQQRLDSLSRTAIQGSRTTIAINRDIDRTAVAAKRADASINQLTGRLRLVLQLAATAGPSAVPLGGVGLAGLAGLSSQIGVTVLAAGTLLTAFQGVGDALKVVNEAALEPSAESFAKAQEAMAQLSPAAQELVAHLQSLRPALAGIRDAAAGGLFPGLLAALDSLEARIPDLERIFGSTGETLGGLFANAGESLASDKWSEFIDFLATDAQRTLVDLGHTVGNLTFGLAELWMQLEPLSRDFSSWALKASEDFASWADGLDESASFQAFIAYIQENGPQVRETLSSLGDALVQIVQAAAPLGGPSLMALEAVADVVSMIADSDLGTPLLALAALSSVMSRVAPTAQRLSSSFTSLGSSVTSARTSIRQIGPDLASMRAEYSRVGAAQAVMLSGMSGTTAAAQRTRQAMAGIGRAAAPIAGASLAMSGLGQNTDYANTAMLGAAGLMMGPWGGALGAGIGLLMDFTGSQEEAASRAREFTATLDAQTGALTANSRQWVAQRIGPEFLGQLQELGYNLEQVTDAVIEGGPKLRELREDLASGLSLDIDDQSAALILPQVLSRAARDVEEGTRAFGLFSEAADGVGTSSVQGAAAVAAFTQSILDNVAAMQAQRAEALAAVNADLAYAQSILDAKEAAKEHGRVLSGLGDVSQASTADQIAAARALTGVAASWQGLSDEARNAPGAYKKARAEFMSLADALGLGEKAAKKMADELYGIPERRIAKVDVTGDREAMGKIAELEGHLLRYGLTEAEAVAALRDIASGKITSIQGLVDKYGVSRAEAKALLDDVASGKIRTVLDLLRQIDGYRAESTITTTYVTRQVAEGMAKNKPKITPDGNYADGGSIPKDGGAYRDKYLYMLAPGEEVISNRRGQADRFRPLLKAINAAADGATVGPSAGIGKAFQLSWPGLHREYDMTARSLKGLRRALGDNEKALDKMTDKRDAVASKRSDVMGAVESKFTSQLFGNERQAWLAQPASPLGILNADIAGLRQFEKARKVLAKKGLDGSALDALFQQGSLQEIQAMAGMSKAELAAYEKRFELRERLVGQQARGAGNDAYGAELSAANRELRAMRRDNREIKRHLKAIEKHTKDGPKKTGDQITRTAKRGARNAR